MVLSDRKRLTCRFPGFGVLCRKDSLKRSAFIFLNDRYLKLCLLCFRKVGAVLLFLTGLIGLWSMLMNPNCHLYLTRHWWRVSQLYFSIWSFCRSYFLGVVMSQARERGTWYARILLVYKYFDPGQETYTESVKLTIRRTYRNRLQMPKYVVKYRTLIKHY